MLHRGGGLTNTEILEFDSLEISGSQLSNEEKVFTHAGAVSSREGINNSTQSLDDIIRETPGAYTQVDPSQGGVSVNIRGMTGLGRVNTMIDGVPQTFFGT
ncbi:TonB-dependent receptor plug domain-containing protein, partial [Campylobacter sp. MIT 19-121]